MPTKSQFSIAERLNAAETAVSNSLAIPEIQAALAEHGYTAEKLNEGRALCEAARAAVDAQDLARSAQMAATKEAREADLIARDAFQALAKTVRAILKDDPARLAAFGLTGPEPITTAGFLNAAETLFNNASSMPSLAEYGYDPTRLAAEKAKVTRFRLAELKQEDVTGQAQAATRVQDAALEAMDEWRAQFIKIARVALRDMPEQLERIGIPERTTPTEAQRAARRKEEPPQ